MNAIAKNILCAAVVVIALRSSAHAQIKTPSSSILIKVDSSSPVRVMSFEEFLDVVAKSNLDYASQRFTIPIAEASIEIAKEFPSPQLSASYEQDVSGAHAPPETDLGISQTIALGGKREARSDAAQAGVTLASSQVEDFFRTLRSSAAEGYVDAWSAQHVLEFRRSAADMMDQLVQLNERRVASGDLGSIDLAQSRVDAVQTRGDLEAAHADARSAQLELARLAGQHSNDTLIGTRDSLMIPEDAFNVESLVARAIAQRSDVIAARNARDVASMNLQLASANRVIDIDAGISAQYTNASASGAFPGPSSTMVMLSLSAPIPISNFFYNGEVVAARWSIDQAEQSLRAAELNAETQVRQAFTQWRAAANRSHLFSDELMRDAQKVLQAKLFSYEHGSVSLLEVLVARRTMIDIEVASNTTRAEYAKTLIDLETAAGMWDLKF